MEPSALPQRQQGFAVGGSRQPQIQVCPPRERAPQIPPNDSDALRNSHTRRLSYSAVSARPRRPLHNPLYEQQPSAQFEPEQPGTQVPNAALEYQRYLGGYTPRQVAPQGADPELASRQLPNPEAPYLAYHWDPPGCAEDIDPYEPTFEQIGPKSRHRATPASAFSSEDGALLSRTRQQQLMSDRPRYRVGPGQGIERGMLGSQFESMGDRTYRTGYLLDANTGQVYETYEEDVMPPTQDSQITAEDLSKVSRKLLNLNGGENHRVPPPIRREVASDPHGVYDGPLTQEQRQALADIRRAEDRERAQRQLWHNRNDASYGLAEQDTAEVPAGMLGNHYYIRTQPYMPPQFRGDETCWRPTGDVSQSGFGDRAAMAAGPEYDPSDARGVTEYARPGTATVAVHEERGALHGYHDTTATARASTDGYGSRPGTAAVSAHEERGALHGYNDIAANSRATTDGHGSRASTWQSAQSRGPLHGEYSEGLSHGGLSEDTRYSNWNTTQEYGGTYLGEYSEPHRLESEFTDNWDPSTQYPDSVQAAVYAAEYNEPRGIENEQTWEQGHEYIETRAPDFSQREPSRRLLQEYDGSEYVSLNELVRLGNAVSKALAEGRPDQRTAGMHETLGRESTFEGTRVTAQSRGAHATRSARADRATSGRSAAADGHQAIGAGHDPLYGAEHNKLPENRGMDERNEETASEMYVGSGDRPTREIGIRDRESSEALPPRQPQGMYSSQAPAAIRLMNRLRRSIG